MFHLFLQGCAGKIVQVFEQHFGYVVCAGLGVLLLGMKVLQISLFISQILGYEEFTFSLRGVPLPNQLFHLLSESLGLVFSLCLCCMDKKINDGKV